jgi:EAL domain-containing protein (putative c-di-GMP-specific phosphodiesterase class I)
LIPNRHPGQLRKITKTIIALGRELRIRVTVEGVETGKQAAFLDRANCDQVQGYFFGRPIPACDVAASYCGAFSADAQNAAPNAVIRDGTRG